MNISKELLSEVLNIPKEKAKFFVIGEYTGHNSINIYQLAYRCKEYSKKQGITYFNSSIGDNEGIASFYNGFKEYRFEADTEIEAVFKATQWIYDNCR